MPRLAKPAWVKEIARRLLISVFVLWGTVTLVFFISRGVGDPARLALPDTATLEQIEALRDRLGLTGPLIDQYGRFLSHAVRGDLGEAVSSGQSVVDVIKPAVPRTLLLAGVTMLVAVVVSLVLAVWAVASRNWLVDRLIMLFSFASVSLPEFWFALVLIYFVSVRMGLLPTSGIGGWQHLVLPVLTLVVRPVGRLAQATRRSLMEEMRQDYVLAAHARGFSRRKVLRGHALRNSLLAVITLAGDEMANLITGAVIVETIFAWPGVGYLTILAIQQRDPFLVVGVVIVVSALVLILNLIIDILYALVNPRVRTGWASARAA